MSCIVQFTSAPANIRLSWKVYVKYVAKSDDKLYLPISENVQFSVSV